MPTTMKFVIAAAAMALLHGATARADTPVGLWETGESHVEIYRCGELLCGRIAALLSLIHI